MEGWRAENRMGNCYRNRLRYFLKPVERCRQLSGTCKSNLAPSIQLFFEVGYRWDWSIEYRKYFPIPALARIIYSFKEIV